FDIGIVAIGGAIENSVLSTILLKKLGVRYIIARADNELHGTILEKIGADRVVYPLREMGIGIAHVLTLGDVIDYIPVSPGYGVVKLIAPPPFVGQTLAELGFGPKGKWKVAVLLILRKQGVTITPSDAEMIKPEDVLIVSGSWDNLEELFVKFQKT
ncbi:MAG: TrkA C-terminal domain-containing protein, partial [Chloroflexota bacterium]|nr:TrkA C-terminal domain-containing protein [Chloroflexota bacterium]